MGSSTLSVFIFTLIILFSIYIFICAYSYVNAVSQNLSDTVFRLHVIANSDSIIFFGSTDMETCNFFSTLLSSKKIENGTEICFMTAEEFLRLGWNKCVVAIRGYEPIIDDKYAFFEVLKNKNIPFWLILC